ncbi:MAG: hypothetical protein Q8Q08_00145 [Candidatus Omnitrophota bacterium]|nr:hypothetical protein [Candidatus Omnitrophota bacterium]MDZ4242182.1 hypothetical protein [Candidatus Omnitrophota bacterium]
MRGDVLRWERSGWIAGMIGCFCLLLVCRAAASQQDAAVPPQRFSSAQLIKNAKAVDGFSVVFSGEVVGDVLRRDDHAWVNLRDDAGFIGVWMPLELADKVALPGDYFHAGDTVEVTGRFFRADERLGGELCIRADTLTVLAPGFAIPRSLNATKIQAAAALLLGIAVLGIFHLITKKRYV